MNTAKRVLDRCMGRNMKGMDDVMDINCPKCGTKKKIKRTIDHPGSGHYIIEETCPKCGDYMQHEGIL